MEKTSRGRPQQTGASPRILPPSHPGGKNRDDRGGCGDEQSRVERRDEHGGIFSRLADAHKPRVILESGRHHEAAESDPRDVSEAEDYVVDAGGAAWLNVKGVPSDRRRSEALMRGEAFPRHSNYALSDLASGGW